MFVWDSPNERAGLSEAERHVLRLVVEGRSNGEIARLRGTSARTVANQVASLLKKLGADSRFQLIGRMPAPASAGGKTAKRSRRAKRTPKRLGRGQ